MKRPYRLQYVISTTPLRWHTLPGAYGHLTNAIDDAKRLRVGRVFDVVAKREMWNARTDGR